MCLNLVIVNVAKAKLDLINVSFLLTEWLGNRFETILFCLHVFTGISDALLSGTRL